MTWIRLQSLIDMNHRAVARDMYDFGVAMSYAYHKPGDMKKLLPRPEVDLDSLPAMLRPAKKVTNG
jgi:hypothetical protein